VLLSFPNSTTGRYLQRLREDNWALELMDVGNETDLVRDDIFLAVLDTGVDLEHPEFTKTSVDYGYRGEHGDVRDHCGHGMLARSQSF